MSENQTPDVVMPDGTPPQNTSLPGPDTQAVKVAYMAIVTTRPTCQSASCGSLVITLGGAQNIQHAANILNNWMLLNNRDDNPILTAEVFEYNQASATFDIAKWNMTAPAEKARLIEANEKAMFDKLKAKYEPGSTPAASQETPAAEGN